MNFFFFLKKFDRKLGKIYFFFSKKGNKKLDKKRERKNSKKGNG